MTTPGDEPAPSPGSALPPEDDRDLDDALVERLAAIDDRLVGKTAPDGGTIDLGDVGDAVRLADHLDVMLRLRAAAERSRAGTGAGAGNDAAHDGLVLGPFRTLHEIGRGGFAVVYEAVDARLGRHVALKVIRPETLHLPGLAQRFHHDAEFAARINHPQVVTVYEVGQSDGFSYIAQELCTGGSLAGWLAAHPGPVDPRLAAEIVRGLAEAVGVAHGLDILHRDITPANVLLAADPLGPIDVDGIRHRAKLGDFGLAKVISDDGDGVSRLTRSNARPGTPAWMAPEQVDSERFGRVGPATDIHALGLLLDRLLTGIAPHADRSTTEIYRAILLEEPRPADDVVRGLPGDLVAVGLKARAKRPEQRYGSSAAFAADLGRFLAGTPTIARPRTAFERLWDAGRRRAGLLAIASAVAVAILACSVVVWQRIEAGRRDEETRSTLARARLREEAEVARKAFEIWQAGDVKSALGRLSGDSIAASLPVRWLRGRTRAEQDRLLDRADPASPFPAERLDLYSIGLSADDRIGVGGADGTLFLFDSGGKAPAIAFRAHDEINDVVFSPDGRFVATVGEDGAVRLWRGNDGTKIGETGSSHGVFGIAFSPDGDRIAWGGRARTVEIQALAPDGTPTGPVTRHEPFAEWTDLDRVRPDTEAVVFLDATTLAAASGNEIVVMTADDGGPLRALGLPNQPVGQIILSPSGDQLLSIGAGRIPLLWDWRTGKLVKSFREHPNRLQGAAFSPDGTAIATGCRDGVIRIYDIDSGDERGRLVGHTDRTWDIAWERSGTILSGGADGTLRRWSPTTGIALAGFHEESLPSGSVLGMTPIGNEGDWLVAAMAAPAFVCRGPQGPCREVSSLRFDFPHQVAATPDRRRIAIADTTAPVAIPRANSDGHELLLASIENGAISTVDTIPTPLAASLGCLSDGTVLAGLHDGTLTASRRGSTGLQAVKKYPSAIDAIAFSEVGSNRVAIGLGPALDLFPCRADGLPDTGRVRHLVRGLDRTEDYVLEVAWSPDGRRLAYGIRNREVRVIDAESGAPIGLPIALGSATMAIAWSSDGRSLVIADRDTVRLCDAETGLTLDEVRPGWPITSIGLDDAPGRPGVLLVGGGVPDRGRLLRLDLGQP